MRNFRHVIRVKFSGHGGGAQESPRLVIRWLQCVINEADTPQAKGKLISKLLYFPGNKRTCRGFTLTNLESHDAKKSGVSGHLTIK
jgi:hypothetical protein